MSKYYSLVDIYSKDKAKLQQFIDIYENYGVEELKNWYPKIVDKYKITINKGDTIGLNEKKDGLMVFDGKGFVEKQVEEKKSEKINEVKTNSVVIFDKNKYSRSVLDNMYFGNDLKKMEISYNKFKEIVSEEKIKFEEFVKQIKTKSNKFYARSVFLKDDKKTKVKLLYVVSLEDVNDFIPLYNRIKSIVSSDYDNNHNTLPEKLDFDKDVSDYLKEDYLYKEFKYIDKKTVLETPTNSPQPKPLEKQISRLEENDKSKATNNINSSTVVKQSLTNEENILMDSVYEIGKSVVEDLVDEQLSEGEYYRLMDIVKEKINSDLANVIVETATTKNEAKLNKLMDILEIDDKKGKKDPIELIVTEIFQNRGLKYEDYDLNKPLLNKIRSIIHKLIKTRYDAQFEEVDNEPDE